MRRAALLALVLPAALAGCGGSDDSTKVAGVEYEVVSAKSNDAPEVVPRDHVVVRLDVDPGGARITPRQFTLRVGDGPPLPATDLAVARPGSLTDEPPGRLVLVFVTSKPVEDAKLTIRAADGSGEAKTLDVDG